MQSHLGWIHPPPPPALDGTFPSQDGKLRAGEVTDPTLPAQGLSPPAWLETAPKALFFQLRVPQAPAALSGLHWSNYSQCRIIYRQRLKSSSILQSEWGVMPCSCPWSWTPGRGMTHCWDIAGTLQAAPALLGPWHARMAYFTAGSPAVGFGKLFSPSL